MEKSNIPSEIRNLVKKSGNNFHSQVVRAFRDRKWDVTVSPYYLDGNTNKAREIDLVAEKNWDFFNDLGRVEYCLRLRLFVECKYMDAYTAIWFDRRNGAAAERWLTENTPLPANNSYTQKHHYLSSSDKVAKLFSTEKARNEENEPLYKALNQALHAMVSLRGSYAKHANEDARRFGEVKSIELPIIICKSFDKMYHVDLSNPESILPIEENFLFEIDYAYLDSQAKRRNEFFLVDIVSLDNLDSLFTALDNDLQAIKVLWGGQLREQARGR